MTIAWAMEQCGIHKLVNSNRQVALAQAHIEALGLLAAAGRALPFVGWATGRASAAPGVNIPGMRHRNPLIFDTAGGHRGGDAEWLLERVVRRIEGSVDSHRTCEGPGGDRDDRGREVVNMTSEGSAAHGGRGDCDGHPEAAGDGASRAHVERPGAEREDECADCTEQGDTHGYAGDAGNPAPCGPPYSGTRHAYGRRSERRAESGPAAGGEAPDGT